MSTTITARASFVTGCLLAVAMALMAGCGNGEQPYGAVKGKVTVGGQPLPRGRILFLPLNPPTGPTVSAAIQNGEYAIPLTEGLIVGESRVEVEAALNLGFEIDDEAAFARRNGAPLPPNPIPPVFNRESILRATVKPGENTLNFTIPGSPTR